MNIYLFCSFIALVVAVQGNKYNGFKTYELSIETTTANLFLSNLIKNVTPYEVLSVREPIRIMVQPREQINFIKMLDFHGIEFKVINSDAGQYLRREFENNIILRNQFPYNGRLSTDRYYSHSEISQYMEDLAKRYPKRVFLKTVGKTYEGRWLKTIQITNGDGRQNKNVILVDGGFHAREWISPAAVLYVIEQLVDNFNDNQELLLDYDWLILPVVNADGYEYTQSSENARLWRKTRQPSSESCVGTDPNRNFDFHWNEEGASPDPCSNIYAGPKAFSEPEAVVVRDILHTLVGRGKMYLTVHSFGSLILYPWGYANELPETVDDLHEVALAGQQAIFEATGTNYTIGSSTQVLYAAAGASDDYAFNAGFPISFTMELPAGGPNGFDPPPSSIDNLVKETWAGIRAMSKKVVQKYPLN